MLDKRLKKLLFYYVYFVVFPIIVIIQNISIFIFPFLVYSMYKKNGNLFLTKPNLGDILVVFFGIGAILVTFLAQFSPVENAFKTSLGVLPNFLYWVCAVLFVSNYAKHLDYLTIYKSVFFAMISLVIYNYTVNGLLEGLKIISHFSHNGFSFLMITFGPMVVYYTKEKYGFNYSILAAVLVVLAGALSGSRSGSILTLLNCSLTLFSNRLNVRSIFIILIALALGYLALQLPTIQQFIFSINERTYAIIYETQEIRSTDASYLIRLAQVEKGLAMFQEYPISGTGLFTFTQYSHVFKGDFEGFDIIEKHAGMLDELSSHNSYLALLAEGGLLLFVPFVSLLLYLLVYLFRNFNKIPDFQKPFFWGLIGITIHMYFITALVNVFVWVFIGLVCSSIRYNKEKLNG